MAGSYFMYVVECSDGSLYTGYTTDVERRIADHNLGRGARYTRARRPVELLAVAEFDTQHEALSAEYRFKKLGRSEKDALLAEAASCDFSEILAARFFADERSGDASLSRL